jgi:branched-chain amino acid transport system substrate-binding protein
MRRAAPLLMAFCLAASLLAAGAGRAADPVRIGVTTPLSGRVADRGQSERNAIELALKRINFSGGVLDRPVEAIYADNECDPEVGVRATKRLIEEQHVSVLIGALCTPVTHAIMPLAQAAGVPLVIEISAGQDFVDASGVGGNDWAFKTIASELDIARAMVSWLRMHGAGSVAIVSDDLPFNRVNAASFASVATAAGLTAVASRTIEKEATDLAPLLADLKSLEPDRVALLLGPSTAAFFQAYERSGWTVPLAGRIDFGVAIKAVSPEFLAAGGLANTAGIAIFSPVIDTLAIQDFVQTYRATYDLIPNQRSFFAFEASYLVVDAIRRAGSDLPEAVQQALKTSKMPSLLGGSYAMDDHNHAHIPMKILGVRDGKLVVIASVGSLD